MKKFVSFIIFMTFIMSISACGGKSITMQEVYDAHLTESMLASHDNVYIQMSDDDEVYAKIYMDSDISYEDNIDWSIYTTDNSCYFYENGVYYRLVYATADGLVDLASRREDMYSAFVLAPSTLKEDIKSTTEKDGKITVVSTETEFDETEEDLSLCEFGYVLDAKTLSPIASNSHYTYNDGEVYGDYIDFEYDVPIPDDVMPFVEFDKQTDNLRTITLVFNAGTEKESAEVVKVPKGMVAGITSASSNKKEMEVYADADLTELYTSTDYESDATIYIKWIG